MGQRVPTRSRRRRRSRALAPLAAVAVLVTATAARAAEGMPQLDFANKLTTSQVVWLALIFAALYGLLAKWALPMVGGVLENRAAAITRDLEAARAAKMQADSATAELTAATRDAQAAAQARIAEAVAHAKQEAAAAGASLDQKLDAELKAAEQRIASARNTAMGALEQVASETASVLVRRLTGRTPDDRVLHGAVSSAMAVRAS